MTNIFYEFPVLVPLISGLTVELGKLVGTYIKNSKIEPKDIFQSGGFPSGHSVFVSSLVATVFIIEGVRSLFFAVSFVIAVVVMYDAMKLRRAAGEHAEELNRIIGEKKYCTRLGHSPWEVCAGFCIGCFISFFLFSFL